MDSRPEKVRTPNPLIEQLKSLTPDQVLQKIKDEYQGLLTSLQSLKTTLNSDMDAVARREAISPSWGMLEDYVLAAKALGLDVEPLQGALLSLQQFNNAPKTCQKPTIADYIQTTVIDPFWNFHHHQVLYSKKSQREMTPKENYTALAEKIVAALTLEECSALLGTNAFKKDFSKNYAIAHHDLNNPNVEEQNKILPSTILRAALERKLFSLQDLPSDVTNLIASHAGLQATYQVSKTATPVNTLFKPARDQEMAQQLLIEVIRGGSLEKVEVALKANPSLLTIKVTGTDFSGREYQGVTLYQAALRADNLAMLQVIQPRFVSLNDGEALRVAQHKEEVDKWITEPTFDFTDIVTAITKAPDAGVQAALAKDTDSLLWKAMDEQFRKPFRECVLKEKHFNPEHLLKAFAVYDEQFGNWDLDKRHLFWRQVIGYVQCFLPAVHAQAFAQGLHYIVVDKESLRRSFNFRFDDIRIFPPSLDSLAGLGFDWAAGMLAGAARQGRACAGRRSVFKLYVKQQPQPLANSPGSRIHEQP